MEKFTTYEGVFAIMMLNNIDTDMIIPKQFLKTVVRSGLKVGLFQEFFYDQKGKANNDFVLNKKEFRNSEILVSGDNFGCGSSREHAVWALMDFGFKCVIAKSFANIFYNNCINNGLLPISFSWSVLEEIERLSKDHPKAEINLEEQFVRIGEVKFFFDIDEKIKFRLLNGLDKIGCTEKYADNIKKYQSRIAKTRPWELLEE